MTSAPRPGHFPPDCRQKGHFGSFERSLESAHGKVGAGVRYLETFLLSGSRLPPLGAMCRAAQRGHDARQVFLGRPGGKDSPVSFALCD